MVPIVGLGCVAGVVGVLVRLGGVSVYSAVVVPLRLNRCERRRLWTMFAEQRQAFNLGVVATLDAPNGDIDEIVAGLPTSERARNAWGRRLAKPSDASSS